MAMEEGHIDNVSLGVGSSNQ